jgi:hypothetical protein
MKGRSSDEQVPAEPELETEQEEASESPISWPDHPGTRVSRSRAGPRGRCGSVHFLSLSCRCHRSRVSGQTRNALHASRRRTPPAAARNALSDARQIGRFTLSEQDRDLVSKDRQLDLRVSRRAVFRTEQTEDAAQKEIEEGADHGSHCRRPNRRCRCQVQARLGRPGARGPRRTSRFRGRCRGRGTPGCASPQHRRRPGGHRSARRALPSARRSRCPRGRT